MANPFLHEDILMEIFSRLPAKSVGKFRCLSKAWLNNLSTSRFINLHKNSRKEKHPKLFLKNTYDECFYVLNPATKHTFSNKVELPTTYWQRVVGSCNGLVLLLTDQCAFILVNPITMQHVIVNVPSPFRDQVHSSRCGVGYDNRRDDYKIVTCFGSKRTTLQVYSVKSKVWKSVISPEFLFPFTPVCCKGTFANGAIHWITGRKIVAFNLADEVFYSIPSAPASARELAEPLTRLNFLKGCLCVVDRSYNKIDIWIMKEYGVEDSWTKISFNSGYQTIYQLFNFIGDEEIVVVNYGGRMIVYNLLEGTSKKMIVDGEAASYTDGVAFFDSLVSPN